VPDVPDAPGGGGGEEVGDAEGGGLQAAGVRGDIWLYDEVRLAAGAAVDTHMLLPCPGNAFAA
jgi:hypothetical protein